MPSTLQERLLDAGRINAVDGHRAEVRRVAADALFARQGHRLLHCSLARKPRERAGKDGAIRQRDEGVCARRHQSGGGVCQPRQVAARRRRGAGACAPRAVDAARLQQHHRVDQGHEDNGFGAAQALPRHRRRGDRCAARTARRPCQRGEAKVRRRQDACCRAALRVERTRPRRAARSKAWRERRLHRGV